MLRLRRRTGFYTAYMPTRDELHKQIDDLTEEQLAGTRLDVPVRAATWGNLDSAVISPDRKAGLERLAAYFEHPETAPWDWDVLRNAKSDAWRV
jgi:hypothetical protein